MQEKSKKVFLDVFGLMFIVFGITAIINSLAHNNPAQVLWLCYAGMIITGIGIFCRRSVLILSQVYILTFPLIVWNIDFLYNIILQKPLWGITDYFFTNQGINLGTLISIQHLLILPIAGYSLYLINSKEKTAWKWSFLQITIVYLFTFFLTKPKVNLNCVFESCIGFSLPINYTFQWFLAFFLMIFLSKQVWRFFISKSAQKV